MEPHRRSIKYVKRGGIMNKLWLVLYTKENKRYFTKYFDNIIEMDRYLNKVKHIKDLILIEDSRDIIYEVINNV